MISLILEFLAPWQDLGLRINFWIIWIMKVCIQVHDHLVAHISKERPNPAESDSFLVCIYAQRVHLHCSMNPGTVVKAEYQNINMWLYIPTVNVERDTG